MNRRKRMLLIFISILLLLMILNPKSYRYIQESFRGKERNVINVMELELPHSNQMIYKRLDNQLLQYWDGILYSYKSDGSQIWSKNLSISNPMIEVSQQNVYVVDKSKKHIIKIDKEGEILYRSTLNKDIGFIDGEDDVLLVYHTPESNLLRTLSVLDGNGKKTGEIIVNDGEIVNTAISKEFDRIVIHTVGISSGKINGKIISYNLSGELIYLKGIEDQFIINMFFDTQGNLITVYENKIASIGKNQENNWELETDKLSQVMNFSGEEVVAYGGEGKNSILQGRSKEKVQVIDMKGKIIGEAKPSERIIGIDYYKDELITYSDRSIYLLNKKGNILMEHQFSVDIEDVFLFPEKYIAVISKEKLNFMKIQ